MLKSEWIKHLITHMESCRHCRNLSFHKRHQHNANVHVMSSHRPYILRIEHLGIIHVRKLVFPDYWKEQWTLCWFWQQTSKVPKGFRKHGLGRKEVLICAFTIIERLCKHASDIILWSGIYSEVKYQYKKIIQNNPQLLVCVFFAFFVSKQILK